MIERLALVLFVLAGLFAAGVMLLSFGVAIYTVVTEPLTSENLLLSLGILVVGALFAAITLAAGAAVCFVLRGEWIPRELL